MYRIFLCLVVAYAGVGAVHAETSPGDAVIATVEGDAITIREVDDTGGRKLYEVSHELYKARVQALYMLLSDKLMAMEATSRDTSIGELQASEITAKTRPVNDVDIDSFIAKQRGIEAEAPRVRKRVELFLRMQASANQKKRFMQELFKKYNVQVALDAPPAPPPEEIFGAVPPALGNPEAPVTIVSFSDYLCPYCKQMSATLHQLHEKFPTDVQIIYRHFPVNNEAQELAEAALCAGDQDKFWDYHAALFATPRVNGSHIGAIATYVGLDRAKFDYCLKNKRHTAQVQDDIKEGQRLDISGTPTNFINGVRVHGAAKLDALSSMVYEALNQKRKHPAVATSRRGLADKGGSP
ncbi:MAG: DsbA family protein [Gammaproteobacteria bacterium]